MIYKVAEAGAVPFDDMTKDQQAEGIAITIAIVSGKCDICPHIALCSTDDNFKFPEDAFCMGKKRELRAEKGEPR